MKGSFLSNKSHTFRLLVSLSVVFSVMAVIYFSMLPAKTVVAKNETPQAAMTVFSNPAAIAPADRASNSAGTNPGLPPGPVYPSTINVAGLTGSISKVTVSFSITSTFPDDFDILLVGPTGARSLVISDAGGSGDHTNVAYTFDQTAATAFPDGGTVVIPAGTYRPANYTGLATPEPGGNDNFPAPGPGLLAYTTDFNVFNGTAPNGTWGLYVVDDQQIDTMSLPGGWSIDITTATPSDAPLDMNGDGKTDFVIVRNTGGGPGGQLTWMTNLNGIGPIQGAQWGLQGDEFVPEDYDGDDKDDIAVWRPLPGTGSTWFVLNSATQTARVEQYGLSTDDPSVVDDYDGDGKADLAVWRAGASSGDPSFWYYRTTAGGLVYSVHWGQNGDFPAPGDFSGDGKADFAVQRNAGGGQARFFIGYNNGVGAPIAQPTFIFGTPTDLILPGDYDGDGKTDICTVRGISGQINWFIHPSGGGADILYQAFGTSATDFPTQGDYDGDGKTDLAVWRPDIDPTLTFFFWRTATGGASAQFEWGQNGDYPPANYNNH